MVKIKRIIIVNSEFSVGETEVFRNTFHKFHKVIVFCFLAIFDHFRKTVKVHVIFLHGTEKLGETRTFQKSLMSNFKNP